MCHQRGAVIFSLLALVAIVVVVRADAVQLQPPSECMRMAFALGQLQSARAVGEEDVVKQYKSAVNIAMKCMDSFLKVQKQLFNDWLKLVSGMEKQLQNIAKHAEQQNEEKHEL